MGRERAPLLELLERRGSRAQLESPNLELIESRFELVESASPGHMGRELAPLLELLHRGSRAQLESTKQGS